MGACAFAATPTRILPHPPVRFEQHPGQKSAVQWSAQGLGYSLAFTADATLFRLGERTLALRLLGADPTRLLKHQVFPYPRSHGGLPGPCRVIACGVTRSIQRRCAVLWNRRKSGIRFEVAAGADALASVALTARPA
jgi:hypothetical protein